MKPIQKLLGAIAGGMAIFSLAQAQPYEITWYSIDGGGGTSTGGVYSVSGTIGQPDAGVMSGGAYSLIGGFWGVVAAVQTPGAPLLKVNRVGASVVISWPDPSTGFVLQQTGALVEPTSSIVWSNVTQTVVTSNGEKMISVPSPVGNRFYRLYHQ